jgi:hypothetical protein
VHPREVVKLALQKSVAACIVYHNHILCGFRFVTTGTDCREIRQLDVNSRPVCKDDGFSEGRSLLVFTDGLDLEERNLSPRPDPNEYGSLAAGGATEKPLISCDSLAVSKHRNRRVLPSVHRTRPLLPSAYLQGARNR